MTVAMTMKIRLRFFRFRRTTMRVMAYQVHVIDLLWVGISYLLIDLELFLLE